MLTGLAKVARKEPARPRAKEKVVASWDSEAAAKAVCSRGSSFLCGKTGHSANECTERVANSVDEVGEDDAAVSSIGGVWVIAAVDSKEDREEGFLNERETSNKSQDAQGNVQDTFEEFFSNPCTIGVQSERLRWRPRKARSNSM